MRHVLRGISFDEIYKAAVSTNLISYSLLKQVIIENS